MKMLGLSFGRKDKNCDIAVKSALLAAKEEGADIGFINTVRLNIQHCTGCDACTMLKAKGEDPLCPIKDDFPFLEKEIMDADGLIIAAPVYVLAASGQYKNVCDRMGRSHDKADAIFTNEKREKSGEPLLDGKYFKDRFVGLISVGGARTEHWTSFGIPSLYYLIFPLQMTVVDHYNLYGGGDLVSPAFHPELLERFERMGRNVASMAGKTRDNAPWFGDEDGVCPVCHGNLISIGKTREVECPLCGIKGEIRIDGDQVKVDFPESEQDRSRLRIGGDIEHMLEIYDFMKHWGAKLNGREHEIQALLEKLKQVPEVKKI